MPQKRRRSPQEKKALSYAKDRRNLHGENDKASRKNIPRSRARGHRSNRRRAAAALGQYEELSEEQAALTENALVNDLDRLSRWRKWPDQTLAVRVEEQARRREFLDGRKQWSKKMRAKAKEQDTDGYMASWGGSEVDSFFKPL